MGRGREKKVRATIDAYRVAAKQAAAWEPEVLIVTSPHQILYTDYFAHGQPRGCIGTTRPTTESIAWEIMQNAVSACSRDPRFPPVTISELDSLEYGVDVLGRPEPISSPAELDVKEYGVIVSCGG